MTMELFNKFNSEEEIDEYIEREYEKELKNFEKALFAKWANKKNEIKINFNLKKDIITTFENNKDIILNFVENLNDGASVDILTLRYVKGWLEVKDAEVIYTDKNKINELPINYTEIFTPEELKRDKDNLIRLLDIKKHEISISDLYDKSFRKEKDFKLFIGENCVKISIIIDCDTIECGGSFDKNIMITKLLRVEKLFNINNLNKI